MGVPLVVLADLVRATPLLEGVVEGVPARDELRGVAPGDAGPFAGAGDILPDEPGVVGFLRFVAMLECVLRKGGGGGSRKLTTDLVMDSGASTGLTQTGSQADTCSGN
jgi:hypothetical protein